MASITNESGGRRTIQFVGSDGKRRSVRLGKVSKRTAEAINARMEDRNQSANEKNEPHQHVERRQEARRWR